MGCMVAVSAGLMPTEARGNYLPERPYLRETKTYHSQPFESIRHAGNYFVPLSIQPIFIFCCRSYVKLLDYWRAEKNFLYFRSPPWGLRPMAFATSATWLIRHWLPSWFFPTFVQKRTFRYSRHKFVCYRPFPGHVSSTGLKTLVPEVTSGSWWRKIVDDTCLHFFWKGYKQTG